MPISPVSDDPCMGREELVERILRRAEELMAGYRQNLALIGPPLIGKSVILRQSVERLKQRPPLLPVYLELREGVTMPEFVEQFASTLLYRYWVREGRDPPQTFEPLARLCQPYLPQTTALLKAAVAKGRRHQGSCLPLLFESPGSLRRESGRLCVMFLDEFHRLGDWGRGAPFTALSRQIVVQTETMYVLASSAEQAARRILQERLALLFGHFEVIPIGPFEMATSVEFLRRRAGLHPLGAPALIAVADLLEGHPFALDCLARAAGPPAPDEGPSALDRLVKAFTVLLCQPTGVLAQICHQQIARIPAGQRAGLIPVLRAVAEGHHRAGAAAELTGRDLPDVVRALRALAALGLVGRCGGFWAVPTRLFGFWLRSAYKIQHGTVHLEPAAAEQAFGEEVRRFVATATSRAPQTVLETVGALLRKFQNELIVLNGRRWRLPTLDVHTVLLPGVPRAVVGQRNDAPWFCVPYPAYLREGEAVTLIQSLRRTGTPWGRCIVIALEGLEVNAKLLLQEQRWWVWELPELNRLLELYGVPRIISTALAAWAPVTAVPPSPEPGVLPAREVGG